MQTSEHNPDPTNTPVGDKNHDIFRDPALDQALKEDPLFIYLKNNWRQIVIVVGAVLAILYAKQVFQDTRTQSMQRSAEIFSNVRGEYSQLRALYAQKLGTTEKKEDLDKKIEKSTAQLREYISYLANSNEPYNQLGNLYRGLISRLEGDISGVKKILASYNWQTVELATGEERFIAELAGLVLSKALLDSAEEADQRQGRASLEALAKSGKYVGVSAALTYARTSISDEERGEAMALLESVVAAQPEQAELLNPEIESLK